jgi:hypothetical protein
MRCALIPALPPRAGLVDASRHERLHGRAHALALADDLEECGCIPTVDTERIEGARHRLEIVDCAANSLEHGFLRAIGFTGEVEGSAVSIRTYVRHCQEVRGEIHEPPAASEGRRLGAALLDLAVVRVGPPS